MLAAAYTDVLEDFGSATYARLTGTAPKGRKGEAWGGFNVWAEDVRAWVKLVTASKVKDVTDQTVRLLKRAIEEGMAAGEPLTAGPTGEVPEVRQRVNEVMDFCGMVRATRIARTEVIAASNAGSWFGARQTGLALEKEWLATQDPRTRDTHLAVDGQKRGLEQQFDVGGARLDFPGDSRYGAPAREVVNCRCTLVYNEAGSKPAHYLEVPDLSEQARRGLAESWRQVLDHGRKTGKEALSVLNARTGQPLYPLVRGEASYVQLPRKLVDLLAGAEDESVLLAHNHPSSTSFSPEDLAQLSRPSVRYVTAIGHDGTRYLVARTGETKLEDLEIGKLRRAWQTAFSRDFAKFVERVTKKEITEDQARKEHSHLIIEEMAKDLKLEYRRALPDE